MNYIVKYIDKNKTITMKFNSFNAAKDYFFVCHNLHYKAILIKKRFFVQDDLSTIFLAFIELYFCI